MAGSSLILLVRASDRALLPDAGVFALVLAGTATKAFGEAALGRIFGIVAAKPGRPGRGEVSLWP